MALLTGLGQVLFTSVFGFLIGLALRFGAIESLYITVALTFSSTIIIVKLLSDKRAIDSLHGQIALGFLIVQDLVVVLAMIVLSAVGVGTSGDAGPARILVALGSGVVLLALVVVFIKFVADPLTERLARAPELLTVFAIGQAALYAAIADLVGLGKELGGLLAGVPLASRPTARRSRRAWRRCATSCCCSSSSPWAPSSTSRCSAPMRPPPRSSPSSSQSGTH